MTRRRVFFLSNGGRTMRSLLVVQNDRYHEYVLFDASNPSQCGAIVQERSLSSLQVIMTVGDVFLYPESRGHAPLTLDGTE